ncbi:Spy/CpxP family protein refolding chaperone [Capsulimonas corticalis]|uniref:Spy/CpxP family protein refolding chaperone n=1 Tax=Capsulimonas corticalis TaxID=2219043 RepID=UPI00261E34B2|nr:periplasmic heavy metal sensor [Capsulimonas corticalis]
MKRARWGAAIGFAVFLAGVLPGAAFAGSPGSVHLADADAPGMNLTPAQQQKLAALESASRAQSHDLFTQLQQIRGKLSDLYRKYDLDVAAATRLNQDLNRVQGQLLDQRLSDQQQLRRILTPDQFAQLQSSILRRPHPGEGHEGHDHRDQGWNSQ